MYRSSPPVALRLCSLLAAQCFARCLCSSLVKTEQNAVTEQEEKSCRLRSGRKKSSHDVTAGTQTEGQSDEGTL